MEWMVVWWWWWWGGMASYGRVVAAAVADETRRLLARLHAAADASAAVDLSALLSDLVANIMCRLVLRRRADADAGLLRRLVHDGNLLLGSPLVADLIPALAFLDRSATRAMDRWRASFDAVLEAALLRHHTIPTSSAAAAAAASSSPPPAPREDDPDSAAAAAAAPDIIAALLAAEPPLSRDCIKAMLLELVMAGINASTVVLEWAMAEIVSSARVLAKLQHETAAAAGAHRCVRADDVPRLPYTRAVVRETLRKHTPGPFLIPHMSTERCVLRPDGGGGGGPAYDIPPGTTLIVNAWAIANDPATWKEPATFCPERFLQQQQPPPDHCVDPSADDILPRSNTSISSSSSDNPDPIDVYGHHFELLPFGSGCRICPGIDLALSIVELAVANLAHCFDWSPAADGPVDMSEKFGLSLPRASPLLVVPTRFRLSSAASLQPQPET